MLETINSILSTVQKEYEITEKEAKKLIEERLKNYFTQLMKSNNGTTPVISAKTTIKNTIAYGGAMSLGGATLAAAPELGGTLIGLGLVCFVGSKVVENLRGNNKSTRVSEGREAAFSGQSLEQAALHNNQLDLEALKEIVANDYTKQLVATLLIAYEKQKKQEKLGQNGSKKTFKQTLSSMKESAAEYTSKTLEKVNLSTDKPAYIEKASDHFNIIFKRVQEILITLDDNLNLVGLKLFISSLNCPELLEIINNIIPSLNPSKEECIDLTWVIATAEFLLKKQAEHQKNPAKKNIIQSLLKQLKEPIYSQIIYSAIPTPNSNNIRRASSTSTRYTPDPTRRSIRRPQIAYDEQGYVIPNCQNVHAQPQESEYANLIDINGFQGPTAQPLTYANVNTPYNDVHQQSQSSSSTSQTTYVARPVTNPQTRAATLPRPPKPSSSGMHYQTSPLSRVGSVRVQNLQPQESLIDNRYNHFSRKNSTRSSIRSTKIQELHEKLNLENNLPRMR